MGYKTKTIGILHYQVGRTDGVSLEIEKWAQTLEAMGHTVHLCAGDLGAAEGILIEEMYHHRADGRRLYDNTFIELRDYPGEVAYRSELYGLASVIEGRIRDWIAEKGIDFLIPQNVWSVAANPAVAIAVTRVMRDLQLPALAHNHDFYFERTDGVALTCTTAVELADKFLPPRDPLAQHAVINSLAQRAMAERKGIQATVVPNVFDFDGPGWEVDDYNRDFRARIGLRDNDIFVLQATRIVRRKGIELAVDFVRALDSPERRIRLSERGLYNGQPFGEDSRIVFVLAGYARDDVTGGYVSRLRQKIENSGIDAIFAEDVIGASRKLHDGEKQYSLWDSYVLADFVTYPSLWEGWGNQFLEALRAKLPILLFEYPVYQADIGDKGFGVVSLGSETEGKDELGLMTVDQALIEAAADQAVDLLTDAKLRRETVERNYELGRRHYSLESLRSYLEPLVHRGAG
jgi:glycosyltransferase involved in cell wall biosynthesis